MERKSERVEKLNYAIKKVVYFLIKRMLYHCIIFNSNYISDEDDLSKISNGKVRSCGRDSLLPRQCPHNSHLLTAVARVRSDMFPSSAESQAVRPGDIVTILVNFYFQKDL